MASILSRCYQKSLQNEIGIKEALANCSLEERVVELDMASDEKGRRLPGKRC